MFDRKLFTRPALYPGESGAVLVFFGHSRDPESFVTMLAYVEGRADAELFHALDPVSLRYSGAGKGEMLFTDSTDCFLATSPCSICGRRLSIFVRCCAFRGLPRRDTQEAVEQHDLRWHASMTCPSLLPTFHGRCVSHPRASIWLASVALPDSDHTAVAAGSASFESLACVCVDQSYPVGRIHSCRPLARSSPCFCRCGRLWRT